MTQHFSVSFSGYGVVLYEVDMKYPNSASHRGALNEVLEIGINRKITQILLVSNSTGTISLNGVHF